MSDYDYVVYTDGACLGNPGPGGWAAIIRNRDGIERKLTGNALLTTNNRMELRAVLEALRSLPLGKNVRVLVRTDSNMLANAFTKGWAMRWRQQGWMRSKRERVENIDLWQPLLEEVEQRTVDIQWTKGHNGDPLNEQCDELARQQAYHATDVDEGYTERLQTQQRQLSLDRNTPSSQIHCWRMSDDMVAISDGVTTMTIPLDRLPELFRHLADILLKR